MKWIWMIMTTTRHDVDLKYGVRVLFVQIYKKLTTGSFRNSKEVMAMEEPYSLFVHSFTHHFRYLFVP